ncbi:MAG: sugar ABC transporter permease [Oscillospiraceae bacterium]|nr:sugar ABC transporter permease [Oscillospiraceae bacterium]
MSKVKNYLGKSSMLIVLVLVMLLFEALIRANGSGSLFSPANINNFISQNGYVIILATGMLLCILTGGNIDLSVGSVVILVGAFSGIFIVNMGMNPYLATFLCLAIATLIGAWQAFWIAYVRIPPFVTTLAGMLIFRGLALVIMDSKNIGPYPDSYKNMFNSYIPLPSKEIDIDGVVNYIPPQPSETLTVSIIFGVVVCLALIIAQVVSRIMKIKKEYAVEHIALVIAKLVAVSAVVMFLAVRLGENRGVPVLLLILGAIVMFYAYFTQNTAPGRYLYAMGGNEKAARLSGINTKKMMFFAYTNMGFLAGVAALVSVARFNQASTQAGQGFELDAIGACFIGGASAYGGVGRVGGAVIGAVFMGVLNMGMSILGADQNLQRVIKGLVLLAAVIFDVLSKNRKQAT